MEKLTNHHVDSHVGKCIRRRRWTVGMTQQQLAGKVGIKFQQIQKYESGMNRVSASRLWDVAEALGVSITFFFDGLNEGSGNVQPERDVLSDRETVELVRSYYGMPEMQRRRLFDLAQALSGPVVKGSS